MSSSTDRYRTPTCSVAEAAEGVRVLFEESLDGAGDVGAAEACPIGLGDGFSAAGAFGRSFGLSAGFGNGLAGFGNGLAGFGNGLAGFGNGLAGFGDGLTGLDAGFFAGDGFALSAFCAFAGGLGGFFAGLAFFDGFVGFFDAFG